MTTRNKGSILNHILNSSILLIDHSNHAREHIIRFSLKKDNSPSMRKLVNILKPRKDRPYYQRDRMGKPKRY